MGDLISKSALIERIRDYADEVGCVRGEYELANGILKAISVVEDAPTVDAVTVVHGEWIEHKWAEEVSGWLISNFECSQCHMWKRYNTNFCPECGADMRKKVQE